MTAKVFSDISKLTHNWYYFPEEQYFRISTASSAANSFYLLLFWSQIADIKYNVNFCYFWYNKLPATSHNERHILQQFISGIFKLQVPILS